MTKTKPQRWDIHGPLEEWAMYQHFAEVETHFREEILYADYTGESRWEHFKYTDIWLHPDHWIKIFVGGVQTLILKIFSGNYNMEQVKNFCLKVKFKICLNTNYRVT